MDFRLGDRDDAYAFVQRTLVPFRHPELDKPAKGLLRRFPGKVTGLSRAQLTRLIGQYRATGRIEDRRRGPAPPFERRYTAADVRQLAEAGEILGDLCDRRHEAGDATPVRDLRGSALRATGAAVQRPPLPPAREHDLPPASDLVGQDAAGADRHRRAPQAASRRPAGLPARRLRPAGRPRWREGHLPDQPRRRSHAVRVRRRRRGHLRRVPAARARSAHRRLPLPDHGLPTTTPSSRARTAPSSGTTSAAPTSRTAG